MPDSRPKLDEIKRSLAEAGITYENDADYEEAFNNLVGFFDVLIQMDLEQKATNDRSENNRQNT